MLSNLANKLQETISTATGHSTDSASDAALGANSAQPGRSYAGGALDQLTHSLRALHVQYSPQVPAALRPLQLALTSQKSLSLSYESLSREARGHSRDLYLWGQGQDEDVKDVTDRLAFLNYTHGTLAAQLGKELDEARAPMKQLRDAEQLLGPRRAARAAAQTQLNQAKAQKGAAAEKRAHELQDVLTRSEAEDAELEARAARARREGVREGERMKWAAVRTFADKLLLLARASESLLEIIPPVTTESTTAPAIAIAAPGPYEGAQRTADIRSSVQHALDTYVPTPLEPLPALPPVASLSRAASDRRGFGETHLPTINTSASAPQESELATPAPASAAATHAATQPAGANRFVAPVPSMPAALTASTSPPTSFHGNTSLRPPTSPLSSTSNTITSASASASTSSPILDPNTLNKTPAPLPPPITSSSSTGARSAVLSPTDATESTSTTSGAVPTIAETGVPLSGAASGGPGPQSGSLRRTFPSAEEEKRNLERAERDRLLMAQPPTPGAPVGAQPQASTQAPRPQTESERLAAEEKARLEREERDRVLRGQPRGNDDDLPPYAG